MSDLREAAQQALEAMDKATRFMSDSDYRKLNEAIDALKAALAEPVQEPVAWEQFHEHMTGPFYRAPPQRKPLTEEELDALAIDEDGLPNSHIEFARAIERAHGIGGQE